MTDRNHLIQTVEHARVLLLDAVANVSDADAAKKPFEGEWSIAEVLEHLYLAEISGVTKIWAAAASVRAGNAWSGARPNADRSIDDVIADTWKPREVAPPIATPHIGGPLSVWVSCMRSLSHVLSDLATQLEGIVLEDIVFPHYLSGPLDGRQRLEFLRFHIERHLRQVERIKAALG